MTVCFLGLLEYLFYPPDEFLCAQVVRDVRVIRSELLAYPISLIGIFGKFLPFPSRPSLLQSGLNSVEGTPEARSPAEPKRNSLADRARQDRSIKSASLCGLENFGASF